MPRWNRSSLRVQVTLVAGAFAVLFCIVVSVLVVVDVRVRDARDRQDQINEAIDRMQNHIKEGVFPRPLTPDGNEAIQVLNPDGQVVGATHQLTGRPPMATFRPVGSRLRARRTLCPPAGLRGCMTVVTYRVSRPDGDWTIYTAIPTLPWYANSTLAIFLVVVSLLLIAMTAISVLRTVSRTLAPVEAIRVEMNEISAAGLDRRVPVSRHHNELRTLAESVNTTLDRLEAAYEQLRRFTSDASHELRSPLTAIRTQVEDALMHPHDTNWPQVGQSVLVAAERLQSLMIDLLALARLDAGTSLTFEPTDLSRLVESELSRHAYAVKIIKDLRKGVFTRCDAAQITRLLADLMDNAERHAASQVAVIVRGDEGSAVLTVVDDGAGIPAEEREVVFSRFTRLDSARSPDVGGTGLGLAIARRIAETHGGTLTAEDNPKGARFVLRLPRCDPPEPSSATGTAG